MTEPEFSPEPSAAPKDNKLVIWLIVAVAVAAIVIPIYYYLSVEKPQQPTKPIVQLAPEPVVEAPQIEPDVEPEIVPVELPPAPEVIEEVAEVPENPLPSLNDSDTWLKEKLTELTWRKELLRLVIDDDMVRRLVVFTDNFAQGIVSYDYSPLTKPSVKFSGIENTQGTEQQWLWDESQSNRFSTYVDFLRSFEPEQLATWYVELKPLINEAYEELGYPEQNFTDTLQDAIVRVLDMEIPKDDIVLVRPSVMYRFKDESLESLPETDKLLLRIGKDNLLIIKSFLLEFSDALSRAEEASE